MSNDPPPREELIAGLFAAMRVFSSQSVIYTQAVAERLGINLTDLLCSGILSTTGPITAGRLAELTGLTTGAITGVVDRLERAGYARREQDPADRRRVIIHLNEGPLVAETAPVFAPMLAASAELMAPFSDHELATVLEFIRRSSPMLAEQTRALREGPARRRQQAGVAETSARARAEG